MVGCGCDAGGPAGCPGGILIGTVAGSGLAAGLTAGGCGVLPLPCGGVLGSLSASACPFLGRGRCVVVEVSVWVEGFGGVGNDVCRFFLGSNGRIHAAVPLAIVPMTVGHNLCRSLCRSFCPFLCLPRVLLFRLFRLVFPRAGPFGRLPQALALPGVPAWGEVLHAGAGFGRVRVVLHGDVVPVERWWLPCPCRGNAAPRLESCLCRGVLPRACLGFLVVECRRPGRPPAGSRGIRAKTGWPAPMGAVVQMGEAHRLPSAGLGVPIWVVGAGQPPGLEGLVWAVSVISAGGLCWPGLPLHCSLRLGDLPSFRQFPPPLPRPGWLLSQISPPGQRLLPPP